MSDEKLIGFKGPKCDSGFITMPYKVVFTSDISDVRKRFMAEYDLQHAACPVCGFDKCTQTLVGYVFNLSDPDSFKDENNCVCGKCGNKHIVHDRVPKS